MRTLGIDLAAQDKKTACCAIEWRSGRAFVELPVLGSNTGELIAAMEAADWIGIDAPFGWPEAMVEAIYSYAQEGAWPKEAVAERLRYRKTDWFVHELITEERDVSIWPLSVSSDRIAVCAWRCANLLREFADSTGWELDRIGVPGATDCAPLAERGVVEVYPAGALALWGLPFKGYKRRSAASAAGAEKRREEILTRLEQAAAGWLQLSEDARARCLADDDCFDAFLSSLIVCAAASGRTLPPGPTERLAAEREGWIHLPAPDSLENLPPIGS